MKNIALALAAWLAVAFVSTATAREPRVLRTAGREYVNLGDIADNFGLRMRRFADGRVEITGLGRKFIFIMEKRTMSFNGVRFVPGFAPFSNWRGVYLSRNDVQTLLRVLLEPAALLQPRSIRHITLDAGHGGTDQGAAGRMSKEKNLTLALANRTAAILRRCGYRVTLTRDRDRQVALGERAQRHNRSGADLFVSLHVNSAADHGVSGIECFALTPVGAPSSNGGDPSSQRHAGNRFDADNLMLAYQLQRALLLRSGATDRGVKRARFAVLRDIRTPGALVEIGFISNYAEERRLNSSAYLEKIARGIAEGIIAYHRSAVRRK